MTRWSTNGLLGRYAAGVVRYLVGRLTARSCGRNIDWLSTRL